MNTYNVNWNGLDRGHEGSWEHDQWRGVLNAFEANSPVNLNDINGTFYQTLAAKFPSVQWVTTNPGESPRTFFRDGREAWASTGVVKFPRGTNTAIITGLGKKVISGIVSYADVLAAAALQEEQNGERPFSILLDALRKAPAGRGLSLDDTIRVMRHYRPGDDINEVLSAPRVTLPSTPLRRFKAILLVMTYAGLAIQKDGLYYAGQDVSQFTRITGDDLKEAFSQWLKDENLDGSGQASSYIAALDDADVIARAYCPRFKSPSVYEMPDSSLESLRDFISAEASKETTNTGTGLFCGLAGLHYISHWRDGYCAAAINALIKFKATFSDKKTGDSKNLGLSYCDRLSIALKLFADKRKDVGDKGWLNEGQRVNAKIREYFDPLTETALQSFDDAKIEELFIGKAEAGGKMFHPMWSGSNGSGWNSIKPDTPQKKQKIIDALVQYKHDTSAAAVFCQKGFDHPDGFGHGVISELLMKFHPDACFKHGSVTHEVMTWLGLIDFPHKSDFSDADYKQVWGAAGKILTRMKSMKLPRQIKTDGTEDTSAPDYLTVNEFIWFVNQKLQDIKNEVVKMAMTPAKHTPYDKTKGKKKTFESTAEDQLMLRILASLRTKPFVILAGHSGTGKSRMVKKLAYMTCRDNALHEGSDPGNYCMIEVKPNWHDSTELLGYFSSFGSDHYVKKQLIDFIMKAYAYPNVPFFVCLDEMNLAPVEQYFAEFLSAIEDIHEDTDKMTAFLALDAAYKPESPSAAEEVIKYSSAELVKAIDYKDDPMLLEPKYPISRDWVKTHGLTIPKNLFVVGTVNMDESTNQFSRKVLDRAFTIEMTDACFEDFGDSTKDPTPTFVAETDADHDLIDALLTGKKQSDKPLTKKINPANPNGQLENMNALKEILSGTPFVVAYRFANEYALYEQALNKLDEKDATGKSKAAENAKRAFDEVVLMKLLPRIAGEAKAVKAIYEGEKKGDGSIKKSGLLQLLPYDKDDATKQTQSGKKMREILGRGDLPYLTFWP